MHDALFNCCAPATKPRLRYVRDRTNQRRIAGVVTTTITSHYRAWVIVDGTTMINNTLHELGKKIVAKYMTFPLLTNIACVILSGLGRHFVFHRGCKVKIFAT